MSYFKSGEFTCPCCGKVIVSGWLIHLLNKIREPLGIPMIVSSGYRCKKRNKKVGGKKDSAHRRGTAADIKCPNSAIRYLIIKYALEAGFKRIGIGSDFIHLDVDDELPIEVLWTY